MLLSCWVGEAAAAAPAPSHTLCRCSRYHSDEIPALWGNLRLLSESFYLYNTCATLFPSYSLSPPFTEEELTEVGSLGRCSAQEHPGSHPTTCTQLQQHPLARRLSRRWSNASCCRRTAGVAAGEGENVIFQFHSDIFSGREQWGFLTTESKAELTGSNIPWPSILVWVESVNFCLQK